jgi:hypothetical protein
MKTVVGVKRTNSRRRTIQGLAAVFAVAHRKGRTSSPLQG